MNRYYSMNMNNICKKIKKIYKKVEKSIDKTDLVNNQSHDLQALELFEEFVKELIAWNSNPNTELTLESYINHLSSKYLASKLDNFDPTFQVKVIRKTICKILDKLTQ